MSDAACPTRTPCISHPTHERAIDDSGPNCRHEERCVAASQHADLFRLDALQAEIEAGVRELNPDEVRWLLAEACRASRANRAFDARVAELERELKAKDSDYTGVCLEYADLSDENTRLKQENEINKIVLDARGRTILELQKQLEARSEANCQGA